MTRDTDLRAENEELRRRLAEAEEALQAISEGQVDAIVVNGQTGPHVFSLSGAEHVYRVLVETMREVGITTDLKGTILFANQRFGELVKIDAPEVLGRPLSGLVTREDRAELERLLAGAQEAPAQGRLVLRAPDGSEVPVYASLNLLDVGDEPSICLVAADLSELEASQRSIDQLQTHQREMAEAEQELRASRAAALNLMEDAVIARQEAERAQEALRAGEERYRDLAQENERLYRQQREISDTLQQSLINVPSEMGALRLGHVYHSATEAARVGGDFYDVFEAKEGKIAVLIGDVAGHGVQAARAATMVKDVVHAFTHQMLEPDEVLNHTNKLLIAKDLPGFVTVFLGILDACTGDLVYSSAGHPEAFIRRASGQIDTLPMASYPLGIFPEASWHAEQAHLGADDLMLLYTDGLTEARHEGDFFGEKRLEDALRQDGVAANLVAQNVVDQVIAFSHGNLHDDVAVLALTLTGPIRAG